MLYIWKVSNKFNLNQAILVSHISHCSLSCVITWGVLINKDNYLYSSLTLMGKEEVCQKCSRNLRAKGAYLAQWYSLFCPRKLLSC